MNRYSCSLGGNCEPDDDEAQFPSREACEAVCDYDPTTGITDLDYLIYQYDPRSATLLAPTDRIKVIKLLTESKQQVQPQDSRRILSLIGVNPLALNAYPPLRDYVLRTLQGISVIVEASNSYLLTTAGQVYGSGTNSHGQLGLGDTKPRNTFTLIPLPKPIQQVAASPSGGVYFLTTDGEVYSTGLQLHNQGSGSRSTCVLVPLPETIQTIIVPSVSSVWLYTVDGNLYVGGDNSKGQMGLGDIDPHNGFTKVPLPEPLRELVKSSYTSYLLCESGRVYACGNNSGGQLGLGDDIDRSTFTLIPLSEPIQQVVIGGNYTHLLGVSGQVYACGSSSNGGLGLGDNTYCNTFTLVEIGGRIQKSINSSSGGTGITYLLGVDGQVYACGNNRIGQLGLGDNNDRNTFEIVMVPEGIREIASSFYMTYFLGDSGRVYSCGNNAYGQLGLGDNVARNTFVEVLLPEPIQTMNVGLFHALMMGVSCRVYACGKNSYGELGMGDLNTRNTFALVFGNPVDAPVRV